MGDPISVRHVMATAEVTERVQQAEAIQDQQARDEFNRELQRQEDLKRASVGETLQSDEDKKIKDEEEAKRRERQAKQQDQDEDQEAEPESSEPEPSEEHIIDLRV